MRSSRTSSVESTLFESAMLRPICAAPPLGSAIVSSRYGVPSTVALRSCGLPPCAAISLSRGFTGSVGCPWKVWRVVPLLSISCVTASGLANWEPLSPGAKPGGGPASVAAAAVNAGSCARCSRK